LAILRGIVVAMAQGKTCTREVAARLVTSEVRRVLRDAKKPA